MFNINDYYNESFGIDSTESVNVSTAIVELESSDELFVPEQSEYFDELDVMHAASHRPLEVH